MDIQERSYVLQRYVTQYGHHSWAVSSKGGFKVSEKGLVGW